VLPLIPADGPADFPRDVFPQLVAAGRLFAAPLTGYRCAIDSPERLAAAEAAVNDGLFDSPVRRSA
jgi:mannose-1-phosphate guanylyltransferase/phosphomannomutase